MDAAKEHGGAILTVEFIEKLAVEVERGEERD